METWEEYRSLKSSSSQKYELHSLEEVREYVNYFLALMLDVQDMLETNKLFCFTDELSYGLSQNYTNEMFRI